MRLLVFNAGSSSLKFDLMEVPAGGPPRRLESGAFTDRADGSAPARTADHRRGPATNGTDPDAGSGCRLRA